MFNRVLIANRGEIALRIIRTLREMDITSIAVYSDADRQSVFVEEADEAFYLGPAPAPQSYLNVDAILTVAVRSRADAIHPGYGFLAENAEFAAAVNDAELTFIGPSPEAIAAMGNKARARELAQAAGVPVVPGTLAPVRDLYAALDLARDTGYPVAVKAVGGGGGRGIRVVHRPEDMAEALNGARREAEDYFKSPDVYLERYFSAPRHVEVQILGDHHGNLIHLGERDCSVQRRHQKLLEESPSPAVGRDLRARMGEMALKLAERTGYVSAGTVECLLVDSEFYFLEMNTRIQVEHPITESVAGVDLIREMILASAGEEITARTCLLDPTGHAIEVRINAEDPLAGFRPTPRLIESYHEPGGIGVRVDSGVMAGSPIPAMYDSLIAKLIAWAPNREEARRRALRALEEYRIVGPATTIPFAAAVLRHPVFVAGDARTTFVSDHAAEIDASLNGRGAEGFPMGTQQNRSEERTYEVEVNRKLFHVRVAELEDVRRIERPKAERRTARRAQPDVLTSPMHGTILDVRKAAGDQVEEGETVLVIEAMKMENEVPAHKSGTVRMMRVSVGDAVEAGQELAEIE